MCGIVGIVHREREHPVPPSTIEAMCEAIRHRGPDDVGTYISGRVGLGMRRLSIIDLAGGQQPIFSEDRSKVIVFNGEIYNYPELRHGLEARGHLFRSAGDTETIVHLYEEVGSDCVTQLRGMFALAIWDAAAERLFLARDRFGMKPLYVVHATWGVAFASELKALHAVGLTGPDLDWRALGAYFRLGYIPAPATPFAAVRKVEPGHCLTWSPGVQPSMRRYWDLPVTGDQSAAGIDREVLTRLDDSVRAHRVADVPVAAFLSGGMDSSAVVSSMALDGGEVHAFTARYHGSGATDADETPLAASLAERFGVRLTVVDVEPDVRDLFEPIVRALDEPHADESAIPSWIISERVSKEYKVALAGTGGDELFGGYRRHAAFKWSQWYGTLPAWARGAASAMAALMPEPRGTSLAVSRLKRFARSGGGTLADRYVDLLDRHPQYQLFTDDVLRLVEPSLAHETVARHYSTGPGNGSVKSVLYVDYKTYLPDDLLHLTDRISMAHSLEVRIPFVDHALVDRLFPIPDHLRIRRGRLKHVLREALRTRLPAAHFKAPKRGFVGPTALWLRQELRDVLQDELVGSPLEALGFFRADVVERLVHEHVTRRHNHEGVLWALLCFVSWYRIYGSGRA